MKEECRLCGRTLPYSFLRRCHRCGRLYCRSCLTEDLTEDRGLICLNCARRKVSPRGPGTKYGPLSNYLARRAPYTDHVTLTTAKIEGVVGDNLPLTATRNPKWWANTRSSTQGQAWLDVGWTVQAVDLKERTVIFRRPQGLLKTERKRKRKESTPKSKLPPYKPPAPRKPSKTRVAKAVARLKNLERKKSSIRRYPSKLKPPPAHEKRLYKPEAKPRKE